MVRKRQKHCTLCQQSEPVLYRVKYDASEQWGFVCRRCWDTVSQNNPFYVYGGTWKAKK
jgi:hypothetical protein